MNHNKLQATTLKTVAQKMTVQIGSTSNNRNRLQEEMTAQEGGGGLHRGRQQQEKVFVGVCIIWEGVDIVEVGMCHTLR